MNTNLSEGQQGTQEGYGPTNRPSLHSPKGARRVTALDVPQPGLHDSFEPGDLRMILTTFKMKQSHRLRPLELNAAYRLGDKTSKQAEVSLGD